MGTAGRPEELGRKKGKWKEMDVFILIVTTRRLLGRACHNTGSLPRHFSPFSVQLVPSPRISASTFTIVDHLPLSHPPPQLHTPLSALSFLPQVTRSHLPFDFRLDRPASHANNTKSHLGSQDLSISDTNLPSHFLSLSLPSHTHLTSPQLASSSAFRPPRIGLDVTARTPKFPSI